jgi:anti-sigma factor RsiW
MDELKQIATRYLLGELSEQEQAALEERYFRDPQAFNEVLQVESDLVDAYARNQLSAEMRDQFERSYLQSPSRRNRVQFARALTTRIDEREKAVARTEQSAVQISWKQRFLAILGGPRPAWRFAMALVIMLVAIAGVWWWRQQRREAAQLQAQREELQRREREQPAPQKPLETPKPEERVAQAPTEVPQPSPGSNTNSTPSIVSLALTVGSVRSADGRSTKTLVIPHETNQAQILLNLKDDSYPRYRVSLQKIGGSEIFTQTNIRPRTTKAGAKFFFTVPARQLTSGDYALTLSGINPNGEVDDLSKSLFRVEKK